MLGIRCSLGDKVEHWSCTAGHCRGHSPATSNYTSLRAAALIMKAYIVVPPHFFYDWRYCDFFFMNPHRAVILLRGKVWAYISPAADGDNKGAGEDDFGTPAAI